MATAGALIERADLVVAHNARADRPFVERLVPAARARGYRWMPEPRGDIPRGWWTKVAPELVEPERAWLVGAVYAGTPAQVALRRVSACERFRADPADCGPSMA